MISRSCWAVFLLVWIVVLIVIAITIVIDKRFLPSEDHATCPPSVA
jgi:hypothetical protein